jgi:hypothetical protein
VLSVQTADWADYTGFSSQPPKRGQNRPERGPAHTISSRFGLSSGRHEEGVQLHEATGGQGPTTRRRHMQEERLGPPSRGE